MHMPKKTPVQKDEYERSGIPRGQEAEARREDVGKSKRGQDWRKDVGTDETFHSSSAKGGSGVVEHPRMVGAAGCERPSTTNKIKAPGHGPE
jgi:hypothetical protein